MHRAWAVVRMAPAGSSKQDALNENLPGVSTWSHLPGFHTKGQARGKAPHKLLSSFTFSSQFLPKYLPLSQGGIFFLLYVVGNLFLSHHLSTSYPMSRTQMFRSLCSKTYGIWLLTSKGNFLKCKSPLLKNLTSLLKTKISRLLQQHKIWNNINVYL